MRSAKITPEKVRNIIRGVESAGREVLRIEVDGVVVVLKGEDGKPTDRQGQPGHGEVKWSAS